MQQFNEIFQKMIDISGYRWEWTEQSHL